MENLALIILATAVAGFAWGMLMSGRMPTPIMIFFGAIIGGLIGLLLS